MQEPLTLSELQTAAYANSAAHGFHDAPEGARVLRGLLLASGLTGDERKAAEAALLKIEERNIAEMLALVHSEVSEALETDRERGSRGVEALRERKYMHKYELSGEKYVNRTFLGKDGNPGKPVGFESELADIMIRVGDLAGMLKIDLTRATREKMRYNETRPRKHGKAY